MPDKIYKKYKSSGALKEWSEEKRGEQMQITTGNALEYVFCWQINASAPLDKCPARIRNRVSEYLYLLYLCISKSLAPSSAHATLKFLFSCRSCSVDCVISSPLLYLFIIFQSLNGAKETQNPKKEPPLTLEIYECPLLQVPRQTGWLLSRSLPIRRDIRGHNSSKRIWFYVCLW